MQGGANQKVMEMLREIKLPEKVESYITKKLAEHERIMGIGHRIYKTGDPRAVILKQLAFDLCTKMKQLKWYDMLDKIEKISWEKIKLKANVDFYSSIVLHLLGFKLDTFPALFASGRITGWCAHVIEQHNHNRLIRPIETYVGKRNLIYIPLGKRQ